uniref:LYR motif-containing protein 2 n=1 Tax=Bubo bubo TaxID=30461 RepID=A0A8C0I9S8_BUBBB
WAAERGPGWAWLSPSQFLRRQQVLQLYRKILRAIRDVPAEADRHYLKDWVREEFRRNKDATEEVRIRTPNPERLPWGMISVLSWWACAVGVTSRLVKRLLLFSRKEHLCEKIIQPLKILLPTPPWQ